MKTTKKNWIYVFALVGATVMLFSSCEKEDEKNIPALTTSNVIEITQIAAISGGKVTDDGGATVTSRGVCWSTNETPTIADSKTEDGRGGGSFTSCISGLQPNTMYYVRAYATNSEGTGYGNAMSFATLKEIDGVVDADGNVYSIVGIGNQEWLAENLKTTKYNDGTSITLITENYDWAGDTPAYCWYDNDEAAYKNPYGALYNWHAVNTGKLCPTGWHVPTHTEFTVLIDYLGGEEVAGGKLKATGTIEAETGLWYDPNTGATDETGFRGLPAGFRHYDGGDFGWIGTDGSWWSATVGESNWTAPYLTTSSEDTGVILGKVSFETGFSVRCLRD